MIDGHFDIGNYIDMTREVGKPIEIKHDKIDKTPEVD